MNNRELDALVAEKVMGWTRYPEPMHPTDNRTIGGVLYYPPGIAHDASGLNVVPYYSTDIAAAWQVVDKMVTDGKVFIVKGDGLRSGDNPKWTVLCDNQPRTDAHEAPLAICLAALKAMGVDVNAWEKEG